MRLDPLPHLSPIHTVPRPEIHKAGSTLTIALDDVVDKRVRLEFAPCQAIRIWTVDLWDPQASTGGRVSSVPASPWREELRARLAVLHPRASFLDDARHFVVPAGDDVIEVLAWQLAWAYV